MVLLIEYAVPNWRTIIQSTERCNILISRLKFIKVTTISYIDSKKLICKAIYFHNTLGQVKEQLLHIKKIFF